MFLRRRHLKRRLMEVMKEVRMSTISKTRLWCAMTAAMAVIAVACWVAIGAFPLVGAPQLVNDASGVSVNTSGLALIHRSAVPYPAEAQAKGIDGAVVVQMKLDANGEVADAAILSGPEELRKSVLQAVLAWHFEKSAALTTQVVTINFVKPAVTTPEFPTPAPAQLKPLPAAVPTAVPTGQVTFRTSAANSTKLSHIVVTGLSDSATADLLASLPVHEGDAWAPQSFDRERAAVTQFDPHLTTAMSADRDGQISVMISFPPSNVFSVGNGVAPPRLITKVDPQLSEQARAAKYSGSVTLSIVVGTDGKATNIQVVKPLGMGLDEQSIAAVRQWVFQPGTNQGVPVNVKATVEVNFRSL
jgi:TonB family protein